VLPDCITTDLFPNPWLDRVENAYALSFADRSVGNLILFDVWHHLRHPGAALREFHRVLEDAGRLVLFEPACGVLGWLVYGLGHHEPLGLGRPIQWEPPQGFDPARADYYAAQGNCWRMVRSRSAADVLRGWRILEVMYDPALAYVASGGFRGPQLYPAFLLPALLAVERLLKPLPALFATRMMVVMAKAASAGQSGSR
jgi:SAM-dependent methyltransferase